MLTCLRVQPLCPTGKIKNKNISDDESMYGFSFSLKENMTNHMSCLIKNALHYSRNAITIG